MQRLTLPFIVTTLLFSTLLILSLNHITHADTVYMKASDSAESFTQPSLTNWFDSTNPGDTVPVSKFAYYGRTPIAYSDTTQGWTNATNLTKDKNLTDDSQLQSLLKNRPQLKPSRDVRRHYYTVLSRNHYAKYQIKTKRRIGVYHAPRFTKKPAYTIAKHKKVSVVDLARDGNAFRFELKNGDYTTAAKSAVSFHIIDKGTVPTIN